MNGTPGTARRTGLSAPRRNRFFHGKMMDVHHFEMETSYGISMRRMLNRLVTGAGVGCGLDVQEGEGGGCTIEITPGVAIDYWGREIVVPCRTPSIPIPPELVERVCRAAEEHDENGKDDPKDDEARRQDKPANGGQRGPDDGRCHPRPEAWITVCLCYHECETDPVAVLAGDCSTATPCAPGSIREQYRVTFEPGKTEPVEINCRFPDVLARGELDHSALARWITEECPFPPANPCIPLANVRLDCRPDGCAIDCIDITIRPILYGNELLVDIIARLVEEDRAAGYRRR